MSPAAQLQPSHGRVPPNDLDAEAACLSAAMLDNTARDILLDTARAEHFYADCNKRIYEAISELQADGKPADIVLVAGVLRERGRLDQIGGTPYLAEITNATPAVAHVGEHAKKVVEKWQQRQMIAVCQQIEAQGYGQIESVQDFVQRAARAVGDVADSLDTGDAAQDIATLIPGTLSGIWERRDGGGIVPGVETGLTDVTRFLLGYPRGCVTVVGARPGMGKTSFALHSCVSVAKRGELAIFCGAEMPLDQLALRLVSMESRVPLEKLKSGRLNQKETDQINNAAEALARLPLALGFRPGMTIAQLRSDIRTKAIELRARTGKGRKLGLVAVDYLQMLNGLRERGESRESELARVSREVKWVAGETGAALLALSQLNRSVETRAGKDKRPQMSDLRESGAIEQDADTILFIYRDDYYDDSAPKGLTEIIVSKNRNGPPGKVEVFYLGECTSFHNLAREHPSYEEERKRYAD